MKKLIYFLSVLLILFLFLGNLLHAQSPNEIPVSKVKKQNDKEKQKQANTSYSLGKNSTSPITKKDQGSSSIPIKVKRVKTERQIGDNASMMSSFTSKSPVYATSEQKIAKQSAKTSYFSGKIAVKSLAAKERSVRKNNNKMSSYTGNVQIINYASKRQNKAKKIASFKGPNPIRVKKKPRGSITSKYSGEPAKPHKPANYNRQRLKKGRTLKKSELPNYAKEKRGKLKFDSRETKMWREGGNTLPTRNDRKLPKPSKKSRKAAKKEAEQNAENPDEGY